MTQKQRSLLVLALVGAATAGAGWLLSRDQLRIVAARTAEERAGKLFQFDPMGVTRVTVAHNGETSIVERVGTTREWRLLQPVAAAADRSAVEEVIGQFALMQATGVVEESASDLAPFGLKQPLTTVELTSPDATRVLHLGVVNEFNGEQYAMRGDGLKVWTVKAAPDVVFSMGSFGLREKRLASFEETEVRGLVVTPEKAAPYGLAHEGKSWSVVLPRAMPLDITVSASLLNLIGSTQVRGFVDENVTEPAKWGLDQPSARLRVEFVQRPAVEFTFARIDRGEERHLYVHRSDRTWVAELPLDATSALEQTLETMEDKTIATFDREQAHALRIEREGTPALLVQRARVEPTDGGESFEAWRMAAPLDAPVKPWRLNTLLHMLSGLRAVRVAAGSASDLSPFGLDKPRATVLVQDRNGKALLRLLIGKPQGKQSWVKSASGPRVFEVDTARLAEIPATPDELVELPAATPGAAP